MNNEIYNPVDVDADYFIDHKNEADDFYARVRNISSSIQVLLFGTDTPQKIKSVCDRFQLIEKQVAFLSRLIRNTAIGITYFGDMVQELQSQLDLPESKARQVANTLVEELFTPAL